jgi:hypothetical protein
MLKAFAVAIVILAGLVFGQLLLSFGNAWPIFITTSVGMIFTFPVAFATGWQCSAVVGGHAPTCEIGIGTVIITSACIWGIMYLIRMLSMK